MTKVLIVDDEKIERNGIKFLLRNLKIDYETYEAPNGQEALGILKEKDIDIVLTDVKMPIMDGRQLIKLMKADSDYENLPVVIFSSIVENNDETDETLIQADATEGKPDIEKLIQVINNFFGN